MCLCFLTDQRTMETKVAVFVLVCLLLFSLLSTVSGDPVRSHGSHVYSRDQLLVLRSTVVLPPQEIRRPPRAEEEEMGGAGLELIAAPGGGDTDPSSRLSSWGV